MEPLSGSVPPRFSAHDRGLTLVGQEWPTYLGRCRGNFETVITSFDTSLTKEFLRALVLQSGATLHVDLLHGENTHHIIEAVFKALGRAVASAVMPDSRVRGTLSSKGDL